MITLSAIAAWASSFAGGVLVKFALEAFSSWFAQRQAAQNQRELGAAEAKLDQAAGTIAAQQAELEAQVNAPRSEEDALRRLEGGSG